MEQSIKVTTMSIHKFATITYPIMKGFNHKEEKFMKIFWKTVGIALAASAASSILTGAICKCANKFKENFGDNSEKKSESK